MIDIFGALEKRGVTVRSLNENLDTSTPGGRLVFHVFGALAEVERDLIGSGPWPGWQPPARVVAAVVGQPSGPAPGLAWQSSRSVRTEPALLPCIPLLAPWHPR